MLGRCLMRTSHRDNPSFEPDATSILAAAIDDTCNALNIPSEHAHEREIIAARIVDLARGGILDADALRDRVLQEAKSKI
jgi:hypothetical protein